MLSRNDFILNVLELYDKLEETHSKVQLVEECKVESNPMYEMLATIGIKKMADDLVDSWHFNSYAPKVRREDGSALTYEEWKSRITHTAFSSDDLLTYIGGNRVTLEDVLRVLDNDLRRFYDYKLNREDE